MNLLAIASVYFAFALAPTSTPHLSQQQIAALALVVDAELPFERTTPPNLEWVLFEPDTILPPFVPVSDHILTTLRSRYRVYTRRADIPPECLQVVHDQLLAYWSGARIEVFVTQLNADSVLVRVFIWFGVLGATDTQVTYRWLNSAWSVVMRERAVA